MCRFSRKRREIPSSADSPRAHRQALSSITVRPHAGRSRARRFELRGSFPQGEMDRRQHADGTSDRRAIHRHAASPLRRDRLQPSGPVLVSRRNLEAVSLLGRDTIPAIRHFFTRLVVVDHFSITGQLPSRPHRLISISPEHRHRRRDRFR